MIPTLLFLGVSAWLGVMGAGRLTGLRGGWERLAVGLTLGLLIQLWLPFVTAKFLGAGILHGPALALGICVLALPISLRSGKARGAIFTASAIRDSFRSRIGRRGFLETAFFFAMLGLGLGWLFYTHSLRPVAAGLTSAGVSWEDQSGHAMYASSFLHSQNLEALENPHFSGSPLAYPFLCNFLAASLARLGATLSQAFWLSGWYAGMAFLIAAWVALRDWTGSERRASVAILLVLASGGFGFADFFAGISAGTPWGQMLLQHDYANAWELKLHYHNVLTAVVLPMRSFLFGMPLAMTALFLLWRSLERGAAGSARELVVAGILTGLMPLTNAHTLIVTAWCGAGLALFFLRFNDGKNWGRLVLCFGVPMLVLAWPQLLWMRHQLAAANSFVRFVPGWLTEGKTGFEWAVYWLHNAGLWLPAGVVGLFFASARLRKMTAPFLALLVLGNVVAFQPLVYDNFKLFVFANVAIAALAVDLMGRLWRRSRFFLGVIVPVIALLTASGVLSIWRELKLEWVIVDWNGVKFAELVREHSAPRAVFLTGSELTHPVAVLTGRPQVLGYHGWVTNLGIPFGDRIAEVKEIYEGGPAAEKLLEKYHVGFVVIGPPERREFTQLNEAFIAAHAKRRWESGGYTLFEF